MCLHFAQGFISRLLLYFVYVVIFIFFIYIFIFVGELVLTGNFKGEC